MRWLVWGEIRRRWRSALAIALVLGIGLAAALTAAAGARRTDTAFPRMVADGKAADFLIGTDDSDPDAAHAFYRAVGERPEVLAISEVAGVGLVPTEVPRGAGTTIESCALMSLSGPLLDDLDRPTVLSGRLPDADSSSEVIVNQTYADTFGVEVGDELEVMLDAEEQTPAGTGRAPGTHVAPVRVVGITTNAREVVAVSDLDRSPTMYATSAFAHRYVPDPRAWCYGAALLDLRPGTDHEAFTQTVASLLGPGQSPFIQDLTISYPEVRRAIEPQVKALWLFAVAAGLATIMVCAQLLSRQARETSTRAAPVWRAVGMRRGTMVALTLAPAAVAAVLAAVVAFTISVALSSRFPIGPARNAEPHRGLQVHAWIHLLAPLAIVLVVLLIGVGSSVLATRRTARPSRLGRLTRWRAGVSRPATILGLNLAATSTGDDAVPVRSAAAGAALAVAAVVATVTFAAGLNGLVNTPERYGRDWDLTVDGLFAPTPIPALEDAFGTDPAVEAISAGKYGDATINGTAVPAIGLVDIKGRTFPAIIEGRAPTSDDEIVLGRNSLRGLHRAVGDQVEVDTGDGPVAMTIVGTAAFPRLAHGSFSTLGLGTGAVVRAGAMPPYDFESIAEDIPPGESVDEVKGPGGDGYEFTNLRFAPGTPAEKRSSVAAEAEAIGNATFSVLRVEQRPVAIDNYAAVRTTPLVLSILLAVMAAATLNHLVVMVVRRRRRDLALCAALGMGKRQLLWAVVIQALLVGAIALAVGIPIGFAAGRIAWTQFTDDLGVPDVLQLPVLLVALAIPVVELLAAAVALAPAWIASRIRPAIILSAE